LIDKVKEHPKELTLLTLGPLTNIATALRHYPEFFDDLKKIVMMGGTLTPFIGFLMNRMFFDKMKSFVSEFNFSQDAEATKEVIEFKTMTPRVEMGLDICCRTVFKKEHLKRIEAMDKPIPQFIAKHLKFWLNLWKIFLKGGFYPFDTFVPIYLLKPELFKTANLFLEVGTKNKPAKLSILNGKRENSAPITYCTNFVDSKAKEQFMEILIQNLII
jgi:purine nucleosidase